MWSCGAALCGVQVEGRGGVHLMLANVCGVQVEGGGHNARQCVWGAGRGRGAQCLPMCVGCS